MTAGLALGEAVNTQITANTGVLVKHRAAMLLSL